MGVFSGLDNTDREVNRTILGTIVRGDLREELVKTFKATDQSRNKRLYFHFCQNDLW